jgi:hypothetical protein
MAPIGENPPPTSTASGLSDSSISAAPHVPQYEFNPKENAIIGHLASNLGFLGSVVLTFGLVVLMVGVLNAHAGMVLSSVIFLCTGIFTLTASASLRSVVTTQGNDIAHLVAALEYLRRACTIFFWIILLGIVTVLALALLDARGILAL